MEKFELTTRVGSDGNLTVPVPSSIAPANSSVRVTIEPEAPSPLSQSDWEQFVRATAGCIGDPSFQRHEQGVAKTRIH